MTTSIPFNRYFPADDQKSLRIQNSVDKDWMPTSLTDPLQVSLRLPVNHLLFAKFQKRASVFDPLAFLSKFTAAASKHQY